jgi:uncharacterized membrane protein
MMWYGYSYSWGGALMMSLSAVVTVALIALLLWGVIRWLSIRQLQGALPTAGLSAMEILQQRFARGEIDALTYQRMRAHLEETAAPKTPIPVG